MFLFINICFCHLAPSQRHTFRSLTHLKVLFVFFCFIFVFVCFCFVFLMNTGLILFFCLWTSNSPEPLHTQFFEDAVISLLNNFGHYSQISDGCCYVYLCLCLLVYMSVFMPVSNGLLYRYLQV